MAIEFMLGGIAANWKKHRQASNTISRIGVAGAISENS